jgi:hypothetical protein
MPILLHLVHRLHPHVGQAATSSRATTPTVGVPGYTEIIQGPGRPHTCRIWHLHNRSHPTLIAMVVTPPTVVDWVADSDVSNHTTPDTGNLTIF